MSADVDAEPEADADGEPSDGAAADADALAAGLATVLADGDAVPPAQAATANARVTANAPAGTNDERRGDMSGCSSSGDLPASVAVVASSAACGGQPAASQIHRDRGSNARDRGC
jgi:hypothetical protein